MSWFDNLEILKRFQNANWYDEEEGNDNLEQLYDLIDCWKDQLPNLLDIFTKKEIDWLLMMDLQDGRLLRFVIKTGYKDEPDVDENGKPLSRRTTVVHHAKRDKYYDDLPNVFKIYDRFDVNYVNESGFTHFHVACKYGNKDIVEKFLEVGQDPNCLEYVTGDSPLHLHLAGDYFDARIVRLLLRSGANPNGANIDGVTPLHVVCQRKQLYDKDLAQIFFEIIDDMQKTLHVDVRDKFGRTPLHYAVANLLPKTVEVILARGADLSSFVFPTLGHFAEGLELPKTEYLFNFKLKLVSGTLAVVENLKKIGYELNRSDALTIMSFFAKHGLFEKSSNFEKSRKVDTMFFPDYRKIKSNLSLCDLVKLQPEEVKKQIAYMDVFEFACGTDDQFYGRDKHSHDFWTARVGELLSREFFRRWALVFFLELTRNRLPILCCEMIIKELKNEDLWRICLATA